MPIAWHEGGVHVPSAAGNGAVGLFGSLISVRKVPGEGLLTASVACMASVHALAMDRPSPCPGLLAMRVSSPRWNGWIRSSASAAFSGGLVVLSMVMMVWFSPAWTVQVMAWGCGAPSPRRGFGAWP